MIDHTDCDHEKTRAARARCRRERFGAPARKKREGATPRAPGGDDDQYGQTPSRKDMECHKCGVERIAYKGTDPVTGILLFVGEKCRWYIKRAPDLTPLG